MIQIQKMKERVKRNGETSATEENLFQFSLLDEENFSELLSIPKRMSI